MGYQGQSVTANGQEVVFRNNTLGYLVPERYTGKGFGAQAHFVSYNLKALSSQSTYDPYGQWTKDQILDGLQNFLDGFGLAPVIGEPADGLNAIISYSRGKKAEAALSAAAMIPVAGWAATGGKFLAKAGAIKALGAVVHARRYTPDQQALLKIVKELTLDGRKPLNALDAKAAMELADQIGYPGFRASIDDLSEIANHWIGGAHFHLPGVGSGHIPIKH